ncbi:hypothetical protein HanLR1_Chr07g0239701 [Helianthus annuus]|nr:hypothetical protein HanLR1_Chr07g0239701 [Helianthus annuus]
MLPPTIKGRARRTEGDAAGEGKVYMVSSYAIYIYKVLLLSFLQKGLRYLSF